MSKNKVGRYLKYAVGEIFLVVIGILIALSINNWNENRKARAKEKVFLKELETSLRNDQYNFEQQYTPRLSRKKLGLDSLMTYMLSQDPLPDSTFLKFYFWLQQDIRLDYDNGPYEALQSAGLDFIRDDSLRSAINTTYTRLPFFRNFSHLMDDNFETRISELESRIITHRVAEEASYGTNLRFRVKVENVLENEDFMWIYDMENRKYEEYIHRMEQMKSLLIDLQSKIEVELRKE